MKPTTILVTGGGGFIGSHLVDRLVADGYRVVAIDRPLADKQARVNAKVDFRAMDICAPEILQVFEEARPTCVFHFAAQADITVSQERPQDDAQTNIVGSVNVAEAASRTGVQRLIFASSAGVYGNTTILPTPEDHPLSPPSPYGIAKRAVEEYLEYFQNAGKLSCIALRFANVYGPRQPTQGEAGVVAAFASRMIQNISPTIYGGGEQMRDFVFVKDVVEASIAAMNSSASGAFNIGTGVETSINQLFSLMQAQLQNRVEPNRETSKQGGQQRSCLAIAKAKQELRWSPQYTLEQGIKETFEWYRNQLS